VKPASFDYYAPTRLHEALQLLAEHGSEAKPLAGGQSLVPAMNFRLAQPAVLVDLNGVAELAHVTWERDGGLRLGAMTRQRALERDRLIAEQAPLLAAAAPHIAHEQIRNRGTVGGSLAHADPASELPAVMVALGARFRVRSLAGERWIPAADFFIGLFTTTLESGELLIDIEIPPRQVRAGWGFEEAARRHGDYALAGVATQVELGSDGRCAEARVVLFGVGEGPTSSPGARNVLLGAKATDAVVQAAAATMLQDIEPSSDIHASAAYRRHLAQVLTRRALTSAFVRAGAGAGPVS
jgi:CO/xanthine dehydrogenase FAD-binding subunit